VAEKQHLRTALRLSTPKVRLRGSPGIGSFSPEACSLQRTGPDTSNESSNRRVEPLDDSGTESAFFPFKSRKTILGPAAPLSSLRRRLRKLPKPDSAGRLVDNSSWSRLKSARGYCRKHLARGLHRFGLLLYSVLRILALPQKARELPLNQIFHSSLLETSTFGDYLDCGRKGIDSSRTNKSG
jgi:hypothetical protein